MALMEAGFFSQTLGLNCQANVIIPQSSSGGEPRPSASAANSGIGVKGSSKQKTYPVLWLLHGASDDHTIWLRRTSIERYVSHLGIAVVMPAAHLSGYVNMAHGQKYADFFTDELPKIMQDFFPLSAKREDNYVAGLSMGGAGALSLGLGRPDVFSAIGCFSAGNLNIRRNNPAANKRKSGKACRDLAVYGVEDRTKLLGNSEYDCFAKAEAAITAGKKLPRIFHCIGREDFLYDNAKKTEAWFKDHPQFDYTFHEAPGAHTWEFWDEWVQKFLKWLLPKCDS
ncbi:tributyrin esterase [Spirochaetia bacterium]|nr:tributyrin esterase [Spirochaetia bacterium]